MTITAQVGGDAGGGAFAWIIQYDDATRDVTTSATGIGWCYAPVQITSSITRTVAYFPVSGGTSQNPDLAAKMAAADFRITSDGSTTVLVSNVPANQVARIVGKPGALGGLPAPAEWSRA
jgi:hypothetical protein